MQELRAHASNHTIPHQFTLLHTPSSHFATLCHVASAQAAQQRLREACTALDGAEGRGRWKAVQGHLVARRDRLVSELAAVYEVRLVAHCTTTQGRGERGRCFDWWGRFRLTSYPYTRVAICCIPETARGLGVGVHTRFHNFACGAPLLTGWSHQPSAAAGH